MKRFLVPLILSQIADLVSTGLAISQGGYESNPIAVFLYTHGGIPMIVMSKVLVVLICVLVLENALQYKDKYATIAKTVITMLIVASFAVAIWNTFVAFTQWTLS